MTPTDVASPGGMFGLSPLDLVTLVIYLVGITGVGLWAARKVHTTADYFMGGRRFGRWMMLMHNFGSGTHADQAVTVAGASYRIGLAGIWYQWLWLFVTPFYWITPVLFRRMRCLTTADYFEERFSPGLGIFYSFAGIFFMMLAMGMMLQGTGRTVEAITDGAVPMWMSVSIMTLLFVTYGVAGGLPAAVVTDFIQGIFIIIMSFLLVPFLLDKVGGFEGLHQQVPAHMFDLTAPGDLPPPYEPVTLFYISMVVLNALVGIVAQPQSMEAGGAARTELDSRIGGCFGPMLKRLCTVAWAFVGIGAIALYPGLEHPELAFGTAVRDLLPAGLVGVMLASMLAAVMSSCDTFMNVAAALFTKNLYQRYLVRDREDRHYLSASRLISLVIVAGGLVLTFAFGSVAELLQFFWKVTGLVGICFWAGVLWRRANRWGAWASIAVSGAVLIFASDLSLADQIAWYLSCGVFAMIVVSLLTPPEPAAMLDRFYTILHTPVGQEQRLRDAGIEVVLE